MILNIVSLLCLSLSTLSIVKFLVSVDDRIILFCVMNYTETRRRKLNKIMKCDETCVRLLEENLFVEQNEIVM